MSSDTRIDDLLLALEEREGYWNELLGRRWVISHEPLRADAKNIVPLIDDLIEAADV